MIIIAVTQVHFVISKFFNFAGNRKQVNFR